MIREYSKNNLIEQTNIELFFLLLGWDTLLAFSNEGFGRLSFDIPEDEKELQIERRIFSGYEVMPVPSRELAMDGGVLNCVTWNVKV